MRDGVTLSRTAPTDAPRQLRPPPVADTARSNDPSHGERDAQGAAAGEPRAGIFEAIRKLHALLPPSARRNSVLLLLMMLFGALLEVVGVAAIPAFVTALMDPEKLSGIPVVGDALRGLEQVDPGRLVVGAAAILIVIYGLKNGFLVANYYCQTRFVTNRRSELGGRLANAYLRAPYTVHLARNTSEMLRNIDREVNIIAYQVLGAVLEICTRGIILAAVLVFLFVMEPMITLYWLLIFGTVGALCFRAVSAKLKRYGAEEQAQRKHFVQSLYQGFGSVKEARILNRETFFVDRMSNSIRRMAEVFAFKLFAGRAVSPMTEFVAISGLLVLAAGLVLSGRPAESILATLSLFIVGLVRLKEMISAVTTHLANLRYNAVSVGPVYNDLMWLESAPGARRTAAQPPAPQRVEREIALRDVWYRYDGAEDHALAGADIAIPAGAAVGFVGSTGAGKSTVIDILLGLLDPERGAVLVDGVDIRESGVGAWQTAIGYVPQSIYLLDDTIRRNIALGLHDEEIDEAALMTAIRTAQLETFVNRQPKGLDSVIGEQGVRLSGGERQRIGIARALYHDPQVPILDEATSSLDNATEKAVIAAVEALRGQRTVIMVAHRLTTVKNCDRLYFLKDGRIEGTGSYAELKDRHAEFRLMAAG